MAWNNKELFFNQKMYHKSNRLSEIDNFPTIEEDIVYNTKSEELYLIEVLDLKIKKNKHYE